MEFDSEPNEANEAADGPLDEDKGERRENLGDRHGVSTSEASQGSSVEQSESDGDLTPAERVVISYPEDLSDWGRWQVEKDPFEAYLRKTKTERVRQGDVWEEFVGVGCCGSTLDVPLRVERIDGGTTFGPDTEIEWEVREACGIQGGWKVQSQGGPNEV